MITSKVSKRYAKALLSLGKEDGKYQQYGKELLEFSSFFQQNAEFAHAVSNPTFDLRNRKRILNLVFEKSRYSDTVMNFLNLLLDKNRLSGIAGICAFYQKLMDEVANVARAEVITPGPLHEDTRNRLEKVLEGLTARKIRMESKEDNTLIGGIVVKIGDLVLDGSIKAQLKGLKESLKRGEYS
ncbi:MAG: ATP synthase F1 subunit delta [Deltaproteobacteria bacterium]|nr:ATP synthase F1 subunit delta [Deltaproteobacteria bacterium]